VPKPSSGHSRRRRIRRSNQFSRECGSRAGRSRLCSVRAHACTLLAAGRRRVIQCPDTLDFLPPVFNVLGETIFLGARPDEFFAWPFAVFVGSLVDFTFQPRHGVRRFGQIEAADIGGRRRLLTGSLAGGDAAQALGLGQHFPLDRLQFLHPTLHLLNIRTDHLMLRRRQGCFGAALFIGIAAAVKIGLRQRLCIPWLLR